MNDQSITQPVYSIESLEVKLDSALEHAAHAWNDLCKLTTVNITDYDMWPPQVKAEPGTAPYHLAAMIRYVKEAYDLIHAEQERIESLPIEGLKPLPPPPYMTGNLLAQRTEQALQKIGDQTCACTQCSWAGTVDETEDANADGDLLCPVCGAIVNVAE